MSEYGAPDPLFLVTREDDLVLASVGLRYQVDRMFSVRPELRYTNNSSEIELNEFDRVEVGVSVRADF